MTPNEYLQKVLQSQTIAPNSTEMKALDQCGSEVKTLLAQKYPEDGPVVKYGGSKAKGTMIRESYDLDIICYFPNDSTTAGETLEAIYESVYVSLAEKYVPEKKASAIRLWGKNDGTSRVDFHVDVVPGRFVDDSQTDTFLHRTTGDKERLKTNIDTHISHVRDSGCVSAIRLLKYWNHRTGLRVKTFVLELLAVKVFQEEGAPTDLAGQLKFFWEYLKNNKDSLSVEDPANSANDLSDVVRDIKVSMIAAAERALLSIENDVWADIFGNMDADYGDSSGKLASLVASAAAPMRPYSE